MRRSSTIWLLFGGPGLCAQGLELDRTVVLDPAVVGVTAIERVGKTEVLEYGEHRVVFSRPVGAWEIGKLPNGSWIILAGGIDLGLDLYLFEPKTGEVGLPFSITGGLRLPATFNRGTGSWPRVQASHLLAFAVERDGKCVFLAVDFSSQVPRELASVTLPIDVEGFRTFYDPESWLVRVEFDGSPKSIEFLHPLAPRLVVDPRLVDFGVLSAGESKPRAVELRNVGRNPIDARVEIVGEAFRSGRRGAIRLRPGETLDLEIKFEPLELGEIRGELRIESGVAGSSTVVVLRGESRLVAAPDPVRPDKPSVDPTENTAKPEQAVEAPSEPPDRPALLPLRAAEFAGLSLRRIDSGRVLVSGVLALDPVRFPAILFEDGGLELVIENARTGSSAVASLDPVAAVDSLLRAGVGDDLRIALRDGRAAPLLVPFASIRPKLVVVDGVCIVETAPGREFLLHAMLPGSEGADSGRILRSWRGVADARGRSRIPLAALPKGIASLFLVAVESGTESGRQAWSNRLEVPR